MDVIRFWLNVFHDAANRSFSTIQAATGVSIFLVLWGCLTVVVALLRKGDRAMPPELKDLLDGFPALAIACLLVWTWHLARVPAHNYREMQDKKDEIIARLGGAPDVPVVLPPLQPAEKHKVADTLLRLSEFLNNEAQDACHRASNLARANVRDRPSAHAAQGEETFRLTRRVYTVLLGPNNDGGLLKSGDPLVMKVMAQAIQPKDHDIIIHFDGYAREAAQLLGALRVADSSHERAKLFEPVMTAVSVPLNQWSVYADRFCALITKTNSRIETIRQRL